MKDEKVIVNSQHGFRKGKSCLTNLLVFYNEKATLVDEGRAMDVVYLNFNKALDSICHMTSGTRSSWRQVMSAVTQRSLLGPILFNIFINDLGNGIESILSKSTDDTKQGGAADMPDSCSIFQSDLDVKDLQFSKGKCKVLHLERNNPKHQCMLGADQIESSFAEKGLRVLGGSKLTMSQQYTLEAKIVQEYAVCMRKTIATMWRQAILPLCSALMMPHLEFSVQFWASQYKQDMDLFGCVQHRAENVLKRLEHLSYGLRGLGLFSLEKTRLMGDLVNVYKYLMRENEEEGARLFSVMPRDKTWGNGHKLKHMKLRLKIRKHFFTVRVVKHLHRLPRVVVESPLIEIFKTQLDTTLDSLLWLTLLQQGSSQEVPSNLNDSAFLWKISQEISDYFCHYRSYSC